MMKKRMILIGIIMVLTLAMSTAVSAKVIRTPFTSVGTLIDTLDQGKMILSGDNVHVRGMVELLRTESDNDLITGWHTVNANVNFDAVGYGRAWGTFSLDVDAYDGHWEGSYTGRIDENGMALKMRGRGYGDLSGLRIEGTYLNGVTDGIIIQSPND
jgi:hypothetical protein